jgi:hypothetical protein
LTFRLPEEEHSRIKDRKDTAAIDIVLESGIASGTHASLSFITAPITIEVGA